MYTSSFLQGEHKATIISAALNFPEKLWVLVESHQFKSIWWNHDGSCVVIDQ